MHVDRRGPDVLIAAPPIGPERHVLLAAVGAQVARVTAGELDVDRRDELVGDRVQADAAELLVGLVALGVEQGGDQGADVDLPGEAGDELHVHLAGRRPERDRIGEQLGHVLEQVAVLRDLGVLVELMQLRRCQLLGAGELDDLLEVDRCGQLDRVERKLEALEQVLKRAERDRRDLDVSVKTVAPYDGVGGTAGRNLPGEDRADQDQVGVLAATRGEVDGQRDVELKRLWPADVPGRERRRAEIGPGNAVVGGGEEPDVLLRSGRADAARVAVGELDLDDGIEAFELRAIADAHKLLVGRVADRRLALGGRERCEVLGEQQLLELPALAWDIGHLRPPGLRGLVLSDVRCGHSAPFSVDVVLSVPRR